MNGEIRIAPTLPPPGPVIPGKGESGPGSSPQQEVVSDVEASSKVISSRPFLRNASDAVIFGTHVSRKESIVASAVAPPVSFLHGESCPSSHRSGVTKTKLGVFAYVDRSVASPVSPLSAPAGMTPVGEPSATTCLSQYSCSSMTEWK